MTANRVKPPLPGMAGGILGTAFAWDTGRGSGRPLTGPASPAGPICTGGTPDSFTTPRQELHPYDDGH